MEISKSHVSIKKAIADCLAEQGWATVGDFDMQQTAAVASKDFFADIVTKTAFAYLQPCDEGGFRVVAAYYQKGTNVLAQVECLVSADASNLEGLSACAERFSSVVDSTILATTTTTTLQPCTKLSVCDGESFQ